MSKTQYVLLYVVEPPCRTGREPAVVPVVFIPLTRPIRQLLPQDKLQADIAMFSMNPFPDFPTKGGPLPLAPGVQKARDAWTRAVAEYEPQASSSGGEEDQSGLQKRGDCLVTYGCKSPAKTGECTLSVQARRMLSSSIKEHIIPFT